MLGVLGAEFGAELEPSHVKSRASSSSSSSSSKNNSSEKKNVVEGFGLSQNSHSMHTSE